nr:AP-1 complex subunit sigma-1 [Tanacetum cinerariifolium]
EGRKEERSPQFFSLTANEADPKYELGVVGSHQFLFNYYLEMIHFVLLISRQGKVRLTKWYSPYSQKERSKVIRELSGTILTRGPKLCNFVEWRGLKAVYKRDASLYFCMCVNEEDNELEILEIIQYFVETLDRYFGSVCELDLIFQFHKAYYILDEILIAGELQESSKKTVHRLIDAQDSLVEAAKEEANTVSYIIAQMRRFEADRDYLVCTVEITNYYSRLAESTCWDKIVLNLLKISQKQDISTEDQKSEEKPDQKAIFQE